MRKKVLLMWVCAVFISLLYTNGISAQIGVLLPPKEHVHTDECGQEASPEQQAAIRKVYEDYLKERAANQGQVTLRRGDISNPDPTPGDRDLIHGPEDVSVVFGAGESSVVTDRIVRWPADHTTPFPPNDDPVNGSVPVGTPPALATVGGITYPSSIMIGSEYSKNAVVGIYDNMGLAAGKLFNIRLETGTSNQNNPINTSRWDPDNGMVNYTAYGGFVDVNGASFPSPGFTIDASDTIDNSSGLDAMLYTTTNGTYISRITPIPFATNNRMEFFNGTSYEPPSVIMAYLNPSTTPVTVTSTAITYSGTTYLAAILKPYYQADSMKFFVPVYNHISMGTNAVWDGTDVYSNAYPSTPPLYIPTTTDWPASVVNQFNFWFDVATGDTIYTATQNKDGKKDNTKSLLYKIPTATSSQPFEDELAKPETEYIRPTTVLVSGVNDLTQIKVGDVEWYAAFFASRHIKDTIVGPFYYAPTEVSSESYQSRCNHFTGWASYTRSIVDFDTIAYGTHGSGRFVDAAVRILDNSDVYVGDHTTTPGDGVLDLSATPYSPSTAGPDETDVLLVLPGIANTNGRSNFRLKIEDNAYMFHLQDSGAYVYQPNVNNPLLDGYLYSESLTLPGDPESPGAPFPDNTVPTGQDFANIWLSGGTQKYTEVEGLNWAYGHPREPLTLTDNVTNSADPTLWMPYSQTYGSVYGVHGNYNGHTSIHTRTVDGNDTTNIIEIGGATANQDFFKIYSSGMLKNFRDGVGSANTYTDSITLGVEGIDDSNTTGTGVLTAPGFFLSNDTALYIINDGDGDGSYHYNMGIRFNKAGVDSVNFAIANPEDDGTGDLHIQAVSFIRFMEADTVNFTLVKDNEIKVLSDQGSILIEKNLKFANADTAHLTFWAKGLAGDGRQSTESMFESAERSGALKIGESVTVSYDGGTSDGSGSGLFLMRSDNDDVLIGGNLAYENTYATDESSESMIQAGQDIYIAGTTTYTSKGPRSILFESLNTSRYGDTVSITKTDLPAGDITFKAGYTDPVWVFSETADLADIFYNTPTNGVANLPRNYANRAGGSIGADLWFQGPVKVDLSAFTTIPDTVSTNFRAFKSIYFDDSVTITRTQAGTSTSSPINVFAETGNVEAIGGKGFNITVGADSAKITIQAGNQLLGNNPICLAPTQFNAWKTAEDAEAKFDGNILFNHALNLTSEGTGDFLMSAARDIETQELGPVTIAYNIPVAPFSPAVTPEMNPGDVTLTAGRHMETHAPINISYEQTENTANILLQAGRLDNATYTCADDLCKEHEAATVPQADLVAATPNNISHEGSGNGSIFAFDSINLVYPGVGSVKLSALNGDIVTDPYLHGAGYRVGAPLIINHSEGEGVARLEAIDIKLHDIFVYDAGLTAAGLNLKNGQLQMAAFDSILTRNISYVNKTDTGSVFITTAKYKAGCTGTYDCENDRGGIHQGHIVLGYGADGNKDNLNDSIIFDYRTNPSLTGGNVHILAGFEGFDKNTVNKGYGGNITFDYMEFYMSPGTPNSGNAGGYTEILTPNGNIWGKDSLVYNGVNGNLLIDAGLGSVDDQWAILWGDANGLPCPTAKLLNTQVPDICGETSMWRTGNIMMKGAHLNFADATGGPGTGDAIFRTRAGYIDLYDAVTAENMAGDILVYAGMKDLNQGLGNQYGDASTRDFAFTPVQSPAVSGSVFFGADDNIMLNYGNSNTYYPAYGIPGTPGNYNETAVNNAVNPYYSTPWKSSIDAPAATFNVNKDGYLFYKNEDYKSGNYHNGMHLMYRGGNNNNNNCVLKNNGAREFYVDYSESDFGGFAAVASNFIDVFTKFTYLGGAGNAIGQVPGMSNLHGENVTGYGLYMKSQYNATAANYPEDRRATCEDCGETYNSPIQGSSSKLLPEMTYIAFHDEARIHTHEQKSLIEAPVIEFFGHAEMDAVSRAMSGETKITLKADSLIFHDSVIFDGQFGSAIELVPFTTDATERLNDMRYGVINDRGPSLVNYKNNYKDVLELERMGPAITMEDRGMPVIELGYQRCTEPGTTANASPNERSINGLEATPQVGGDVIVAFKHGFKLPFQNTVVANNARISFITDSFDHVTGGEYVDAFIRTDLLRIRNKVEFYTDPADSKNRKGVFELSTYTEMSEDMKYPGIYMHHVHMEPGSELSIPDENTIVVQPTTVIGGYGNIHENIMVRDGGILAPGFASLMEADCTTPYYQGSLTVHNLYMEQNAILRVSVGDRNQIVDPITGEVRIGTLSDWIVVEDTVHFQGKIPLLVMPETPYLEPGCYLFMEYGDADGVSAQYVKNLILLNDRYQEYYFSLNFSEPGKVLLCVSELPPPGPQRYVDLPAVDGLTYNYVKVNGEQAVHNIGRNYVHGHEDFEVNLTWHSAPLKAWAEGDYGSTLDLDASAKLESDGSVTYIIRQVVEPWTIHFGPEPASGWIVGNNAIGSQKVWAYRNVLYINAAAEDIVSIYNLTGVLNKKLDIPAGLSKLTLDKGMYIVTLKDGQVYKIVVQ
ncbi:MAG: T9SS type A sorting domain-containing protein [Tannerella sp.]|nr:T9SS type A sorting domain-containing protein [Tannerella sp.]